MAALVRKARRSFGKAAQKFLEGSDVESGIYDRLPHCDELSNMRLLSVKLESDQQRMASLMDYIFHVEFEPITFLIRDEKHEKRTVMVADLMNAEGFQVKSGNKHVMQVTLPNKSVGVLAKIVHPAGATVYRIVNNSNERYRIQKTSASDHSACNIFAERIVFSLYPLAKFCGFLGTDCAYLFKDARGQVLAYIRPKLVVKKNTLIVKFMRTTTDNQVKAAILGTALAFVLSEAYPELGRLLRESVNDQLQQ